MLSKTNPLLLLILSLYLSSSLFGQVVFSRRVYQEHGRSYQQIWTSNPATGGQRALTHSPRDHYHPLCAGGKITFYSPGQWEGNSKLWSFDPATGQERVIGPAPTLPEYTPSPAVNGCDWLLKTGPFEACAKEEDLTLSRAGRQIKHFHIQLNICSDEHGKPNGPCATPIQHLEWSPDMKWLLVVELGLETGSTSPQSDYYLVNTSTLELAKAASAADFLWLPGRSELLFTTPIDLAPLPGAERERNVWVQQLMLFDPATGKTTPITSGVTNNLDASLCTAQPSRSPRRK